MKDTSPNALKWCEERHACREAIRWLKRNKIETMSEAWLRCHRHDWMMWAYFEVLYKDHEARHSFDRFLGVFYSTFGISPSDNVSLKNRKRNKQAANLLRTFLMPEGVER